MILCYCHPHNPSYPPLPCTAPMLFLVYKSLHTFKRIPVSISIWISYYSHIMTGHEAVCVTSLCSGYHEWRAVNAVLMNICSSSYIHVIVIYYVSAKHAMYVVNYSRHRTKWQSKTHYQESWPNVLDRASISYTHNNTINHCTCISPSNTSIVWIASFHNWQHHCL